MGFDYGTKRIGVAVGQEITQTVTPLTTLDCPRNKPNWQAISELLQQWQPQLLVVGLPLHMDGSEQPLTQAARRFGNQLKGRYNLPVEMVDERLSSVEAEEQLRNSPAPQNIKRRKESIDKIAAQLILQTWLDQQQTKEAHKVSPHDHKP